MLTKRMLFIIFAAFLAFVAVQVPGQALAANPDYQNQDCTSLKKALQDAETSRAQYNAQNTIDFYANMPPIDLAAYNCLKQIDDLMNTLQGLSNLGLGAILDSFITTQITNLIGQACSAVTGTISGVTNLIYSQINRFCIPLPSLNLGLHAPSLPSGPACNGTPLITLTPLSSAPTSGPSLWQIWKMDTKGKPAGSQ